ncbi:GGDEF domain-containing protein [Hahella sp. SMD15-11]|uniref:diguanylate cyclase n=1 Tax=Thermohahella caldifontis TaxID=3142973 RepID=A0AB39US87_9GAMM
MDNEEPRTAPAALRELVEGDARVIRILHALCWAGVVTLVGIGTKAWFSGHHVYGVSLYLFAVALALNAVVHHHTANDTLFRNAFIGIVGMLFCYLAASGGESNTGILWLYTFPPFVFYLVGLQRGLVMMALMMAVVVIVFLFPDLPFVKARYEPDFKIRFLTSMAFVTTFCYILDASRRKTGEELMAMASLFEKASRTDELTQLPNRRDMRQRLDQEYYRYKRHGRHFSIILLDIDFFKKINDTYGHDAGDYVLVRFAEVLSHSCRKLDSAARWGGEEFLVLLPDTSLIQALALAERLRDTVEKTAFVYKGRRIQVTTSAGVCSIGQTKDLEALLKQADINLYQAKIKGRNRVIPPVLTRSGADNDGTSGSA